MKLLVLFLHLPSDVGNIKPQNRDEMSKGQQKKYFVLSTQRPEKLYQKQLLSQNFEKRSVA